MKGIRFLVPLLALVVSACEYGVLPQETTEHILIADTRDSLSL